MLSARFMGLFEDEIERVAAIAFFIPLIQATGGNVGIQSSSLVVQSLVAGGFVDEGFLTRLSKVLRVALLNGLFLSVIVFFSPRQLRSHRIVYFLRCEEIVRRSTKKGSVMGH